MTFSDLFPILELQAVAVAEYFKKEGISLIYKFVTWFTECPYFIFISSWCSIISMIAIINFLYFKKPKVKLHASEAQKIIDILLSHAASNPNVFIRMESDELTDFPYLKGKHIDLLRCFYLHFPKNHMYFAIVKTNSDLRLYATLDVMQSSFRLIATDKTNPDLNKLLSYAVTINELSDEDFLKEILCATEKL